MNREDIVATYAAGPEAVVKLVERLLVGHPGRTPAQVEQPDMVVVHRAAACGPAADRRGAGHRQDREQVQQRANSVANGVRLSWAI
jgi:hypothetical protein